MSSAGKAHRVAVIGGDGIGPEVVAEALKVVRATGVALETVEVPLGAAHYLATGEVLEDDTLRTSRGSTPSCSGPSGRPWAPPRSPRASWSGACCCACASPSTST